MSENDVTAPENDRSRDWFLISLVNMVNGSSSSIGITLNVSGVTISGFLCGGKEYFEEFGREFATIFDEAELASNAAQYYASYGKIYNDPEETRKLLTTFIHLKNARIITAGQKAYPDNRGVLWRGKIEAVDGFFMGVLTS